MKKGYSAYKNANIDTADQGKLILIAYDVAIKHCKLALEADCNHEQLEIRTKHLFKVQDALTELIGALRLDIGDVAKNLYRLYEYMLRCLIEANVERKSEKITEVLTYLENLRAAWEDAIVQVKKETGSITPSDNNNNVFVNG